MSFIFNTFFYRPLVNALAFLILIVPQQSFGSAVIVLTLVVNLILLPFTHRMKESQRKMQALEPALKKIKREFKDQKEEQARRTLELYRKHGVSPFSGFLLLLIQLPLFIALYKILQAFALGNAFTSGTLYSFIPPLPSPNPVFLGFVDLTRPNIIFGLVAALFQFIQGSLLVPPGKKSESAAGADMGRMMQQQIRFTLPVIIFLISLKLPSALALYWTTMSLFGIVHEGVVRRRAQSLTENYGNGSQRNE